MIAAAISSYVDNVDSERISDFHVESFQPLLEKLIQKEMEKVMKDKEFSQSVTKKDSEKVLNLSSEEKELTMDKDMSQNIMNAMDIFRRS